MIKNFTTFILVILTLNLCAQTTANFEEFVMMNNSYLNGDDGSGEFTTGNITLPNYYNTTYNFWSGWAISNSTDVVTAGFTNQYSCIAGSGNNSDNYAVAYISGSQIIKLNGVAQGEMVDGFYINNNTYTYLSMLNGDAYAKKFGGATGDDEDYLVLTIKKYFDGVLQNDSVNFYLADFRFSDNSMDYIVNDWTFVDLSSLGNVDSLDLSLTSTDNGQFGMNTPAYFCVDDFKTSDGYVSLENFDNSSQFSFAPNPTNNFITIKSENENANFSILDYSGKTILSNAIGKENVQVDLSNLNSGMYILQYFHDNKSYMNNFIKE